jgi:hypothetical protein
VSSSRELSDNKIICKTAFDCILNQASSFSFAVS